MDIHIGHIFYIAGLLGTLFTSLVFLFYRNIEYIIEGLCSNPRQARKFLGIIGIIVFIVGLIDLIFNWSKVSMFGTIAL